MKKMPLLKTKLFWVVMMAGAVALYLLGIVLVLLPGTRTAGVLILAGVLLLHIAEIKTALRIGRQHGIRDTRTILMDMLFGFTWWLPLHKGYIS